GMFLLPSVFDYRAIGSQSFTHSATAYASLKDLDNLLSRDDPALRSFWYYNDPQPYVLESRLLDSCFLIDRYAGSGALMRDEDVYDFVATHLYVNIGTPLGATASSILNNSHRTDIEDQHGGRCAYSAFGLVGMDYSQELLRRYCAARLGNETLEQMLGSDLSAASAEEDAAAFLGQIGLTGRRGEPVLTALQGEVGRSYLERPEQRENERTAELYTDLSDGLETFNSALMTGSLRAQLQKNYRDHLLSTPGAGHPAEVLPGQVAPVQPQMWRHSITTHIEELVRTRGLRASRRVAEAMRAALEQAYLDLESSLAEARNNADTAQAAFKNALEAVHALTPMVQIFRRQMARETRREAVRARNALYQMRVRQEAAEMARKVFNDDTDGVIPLVVGLIQTLHVTIETLETVQEALHKRMWLIEMGGQEGAEALGAPDRSCLLYDVLPGSAYPLIYSGLADRRQQLIEMLTQQRSPLRLLETVREENKAEALTETVLTDAASLFPDLADRHILEVLTDGARDPGERLERLKHYLRLVSPRLRPHAPIQTRPGEAQTYDFCVVMYPTNPDETLNKAFESAVEEVVRSGVRATVSLVPMEGANNRIVMTYMQHGIPLNFKAFPELQRWMEAYEHLRRRNPYLDVDKRWVKLPGPGQRDTGGLRERLFTLGLAYGLIASQGDFFYVNFEHALLRRDPKAASERDQVEVDLEKVQNEIHKSASPLDWFAVITQGPSSAPTIPAQFGKGLGEKRQREARDRIAQGRANALHAFANDEGEDYTDVATAIAAVMDAYAEERGRANVRQELTWYRDTLETERAKTSGRETSYPQEIEQIDALLATLQAEGTFGLLT
ncbi:MAG TPA: tubulin-like doman-containing protein, partial [Chthonomonadaceae bacterium]|nr:tubulin-like doman-containing protein [Chthonomonadaceae bacterium]